jgi:hypothetical protein
MKMFKTILSVGLVAASLAALSAQAVVSPHFAGGAAVVATSGAADYAHGATALGAAAKSKSERGSAVLTAANPSLVDCAKLGKASCPKSGTVAPCCQGSMACK